MKKGIIDRFEGKLAVIEFEDEMKDIAKADLPKNAQVGDVLLFDGETITIDKDAKAALEKDIEDLMKELFED